ncbi:MAG: DUF502 domain-containing protein [Pirellulaceae bacterium]
MKTVVVGTWKNVLGTFLAGLFALLPLVITVAIVAWVVSFLNNLVGPKTLVGEGLIFVGLRFVANEYAATAIGWGVVLAGIFLTGVFVKTRAKALFDMLFNPLIRRIPIINSVYGTASQFVGMLNKQDKSELSGMSVVFARFGEQFGAGILALMPTPEVYEMDGRRCHLIYIPTSPVPMTGGLLYVPVESVARLDMPVESLMSIYLSMGVTSSQAVKPAGDEGQRRG